MKLAIAMAVAMLPLIIWASLEWKTEEKRNKEKQKSGK
jgi:hypothetical protein